MRASHFGYCGFVVVVVVLFLFLVEKKVGTTTLLLYYQHFLPYNITDYPVDDHSPAVLDPALSNTGGQRGKVFSPRPKASSHPRRPKGTYLNLKHTHMQSFLLLLLLCPCKWGGGERRDVVGEKYRAAIYLTLGRNRLVPLSLSLCIQTRSQRVHIMQATLSFTHPLPLPQQQLNIQKIRSDARRRGHPPTGEETLSSPTSQYDPVVQKHVLFTETKLK